MIRFSLEFQFLFFTAASYQETRHFVGCLFSLSRVIMPTVKSHWTSNASHIVKICLIVVLLLSVLCSIFIYGVDQWQLVLKKLGGAQTNLITLLIQHHMTECNC